MLFLCPIVHYIECILALYTSPPRHVHDSLALGDEFFGRQTENRQISSLAALSVCLIKVSLICCWLWLIVKGILKMSQEKTASEFSIFSPESMRCFEAIYTFEYFLKYFVDNFCPEREPFLFSKSTFVTEQFDKNIIWITSFFDLHDINSFQMPFILCWIWSSPEENKTFSAQALLLLVPHLKNCILP